MTTIATSKSLITFNGQKTIKKSQKNLAKKEYKITKLLQNYVKFNKYILTNIVLSNDSIIYEYIKGKTAGAYLKDFGYKEGLFTRESFNKFINFHLNLSKIKDKRLFAQAGKYGFNEVIAELTHYKKHNPEILTTKQWELLFNRVKGNKNLIEDQHPVLSQFDLYPENVLVTADGFKIIDWEGLALLPSAFIPAFFHLLFWREKIWRDTSIKIFYQSYSYQPFFQKSFSIFTLVLAVRFIYQIYAYSKINDANKSALRWFYENIDLYLSQDEIKVSDVRFLVQESFIKAVVKDNKLGKLVNYFVYEKSFSNVVVYFKTSNGEYVLKLFNPKKTKAQFKNEISIINSLRNRGLPVYKILKNQGLSTKTLVLRCYGYDRFYYIAEHIIGVELNRHSFTTGHIKEMGKMLARIHNQNIVHGDFSKRNLIFNGNKLVGVVDFEYAKFVPSSNLQYHKDLAHSLVLLLISYSAEYISYDQRVEIFLNSYSKNIDPFKIVSKGSLKKLLLEVAFDEKFKYLKLNPKGSVSKYDLIVRFLKNFQFKNL